MTKINFALIAGLISAAPISATYAIENEENWDKIVEGTPVTGFNRLLGEPLWNLGAPFGEAGFNFLFQYSPNAADPLPLTPDTPKKALVATGVDFNYLDAIGLSISDIDYKFINLPLRDNYFNVESGGERQQLEDILSSDIDGISKSFPAEDITVKNWISAKGKAKYHCLDDDSAFITFQLEGLIPNGVYTVWGIFSQDNDGDGSPDALAATPFAGLPNVTVANHKGKASFKRVLNFCPSSKEAFLAVEFDYHSDGSVYGGIPDAPNFGLPSGIITHSHIAFPFNVERIE